MNVSLDLLKGLQVSLYPLRHFANLSIQDVASFLSRDKYTLTQIEQGKIELKTHHYWEFFGFYTTLVAEQSENDLLLTYYNLVFKGDLSLEEKTDLADRLKLYISSKKKRSEKEYIQNIIDDLPSYANDLKTKLKEANYDYKKNAIQNIAKVTAGTAAGIGLTIMPGLGLVIGGAILGSLLANKAINKANEKIDD